MPWPYKDWPDALLHALQTEEKSETTQDRAYFVPRIEGTPFKISPSKCATKLGPHAIIRMHGIH